MLPNKLVVIVGIVLCSVVFLNAFVQPPRIPFLVHRGLGATLLDEIRSMRAAEIKKELIELKIPFQDVFEKEELVQRLLSARRDSTRPKAPTPSSLGNPTVISTPLYFATMDRGMRVDSITGGGITVEPSQQPYATMQISIPADGSQPAYTLSLLIDTACSGFVLRPEVQAKYQLPSFSTPVTMTGAGGQSQATGLTQVQRFSVSGDSDATFGPMPAAVQDIGGLPSSLDGIIGQSFLGLFAAFELDVRQRKVLFYRDKASLPPRANETIMADASMRLLGSLGIFTANVYIGGRGPVVVLVDTGAACSLLSWKGVADLGLSRESPQISRIPISTGAMGSDNIAIELSHRIYVSSTISVGDVTLPGISMAGSRLAIDIGQIPVIDGLPGVGGILGADVLMRCGIVRISCREPLKITLFQ